MTSYANSAAWWGGQGRGEHRPTLLDLVRNNTLDLRLASLLWLIVEKKASIVAAAGPQLAGKTTLLTAALDFVPPEYEQVLTQGRDEDFSFLDQTDPSTTYVLVPELSDHTPAYLWGDKARMLFDALDRGYSMVATIHADTPQQVLDMLAAPPVLVPDRLLHHVQFVANLSLSYGERGIVRRLGLLSAVSPSDGGTRAAPDVVTIARWLPETDGSGFEESDSTWEALADVLGMSVGAIEPDLTEKGGVLQTLLDAALTDEIELRQAVADYYVSQGRR